MVWEWHSTQKNNSSWVTETLSFTSFHTIVQELNCKAWTNSHHSNWVQKLQEWSLMIQANGSNSESGVHVLKFWWQSLNVSLANSSVLVSIATSLMTAQFHITMMLLSLQHQVDFLSFTLNFEFLFKKTDKNCKS